MPRARRSDTGSRTSLVQRSLDTIERVGNMLPDPAVLFFAMLLMTWVVSAVLAPVAFSEVHPATGEPIRVVNLLTGDAVAEFLATMVTTFTGFHPLGVVLVALLGVGVAEKTGLVDAGLKRLMDVTPLKLVTPMLILVGIMSHSAADAGYVLVIPLGGAVFCKRYVKDTGVGTVIALMLPFSVVFLVSWTLFLLAYWALGIPLGLQATYTYP